MAPTAPLNKSPHMNEWMVQADPPKEANTVQKWMADFYLTLQMKRQSTLKNGRLQVVF